MNWIERLEVDGYVMLPAILEASDVGQVVSAWNVVERDNAADPAVMGTEKGAAFGARNLLQIWPQVAEIVQETAIRDYLINALGPRSGIVRALFFDKPPGNTWALPWHKDYMIAVQSHGLIGKFSHPSTTSGIPQVKAPASLLRMMLTARLHLDEVTDDNGPLRVLPGSHRFYSQAEDEEGVPRTIRCRAGDVLLMRPMLTHASGRSKPGTNAHRRIIHFECASAQTLPDGYDWHDYVPISP